jgi:hypothetical protein
MANTTEDVAAIDITSNGAVVIPSFEQAQQTAQQTASVISTNVIKPVNNAMGDNIVNQVVQPQAVQPQVVQPQAVQPQVVQPQVIEQPVNVIPESIGTSVIPEVQQAPVISQPVVQAPVAQPVMAGPVQQPQPVVIEQPTAVTEVPELPQIIPDVPMVSSTPNIIMPSGNPIADLPPVQMPMGVSAGDDTSAVGSTITGL